MTRIIAAEWDSREVRLVSGSVGTGVVIDHALSKSIPPQEETLGDSLIVANTLRELAGQAGLANGEIMVALHRGRVELRNMQLPKADSADLPDMVRFAAVKHFASIGDTWPLDFVRLPKSESAASQADGFDTQEVLAVAVSPSVVSSLKSTCTSSGLQLKQVGLRPLASGTLGIASTKSPIAVNEAALLIDVLNDEAELVVVEKPFVTFMRMVRLQSEPDKPQPQLSVGEIRRTLIAAMNARPGLQIKKIILWGQPEKIAQPVGDWESGLGLPVEIVDPFSLVETKRTLTVDTDTGKFAPLIGLLHQYRASPKAELGETSVDFLQPRRRPEKEKPILRFALYGTAASLLALLGIGWYYTSHRALDREISDLRNRISQLEPTVKAAQKNSAHWKKVEQFLKGDIQWLDQLAYLSDKALPPDKMILRETNVALIPTSNQGKVTTRIDLVEQKLAPELEHSLRDEMHQIGSKEIRPGTDRNSAYGWTVDPEIYVEPSPVVDPLTLPPPKKKEPAENAADKKAEAASDDKVEPKKDENKLPEAPSPPLPEDRERGGDTTVAPKAERKAEEPKTEAPRT
jgi:Tfp pilus assembly PilM family ATPase